MPRKASKAGVGGNVASDVVNQGAVEVNAVNGNTNSSDVVDNGSNDMNVNTINKLWETRDQFVKSEFVPSITLTAEEIEQKHPSVIFGKLVNDGQIGLTNVSNVTREGGVAVTYMNRLQVDQTARMLAAVEFNVHAFGYEDIGNGSIEMGLLDLKGNSDIIIQGERQPSGQLRYSAWYANKVFNDIGELVSFDKSGKHMIDNHNWDRCRNYNAWVDAHNKDMNEYVRTGVITEVIAKTVAGLQAEGVTDPNIVLQRSVRRHINWDTIVNKFVLEAWVLSGQGFKIYSRNRSIESFIQTFDYQMENMVKAYRNQLRAFAGLVRVTTDEVAEVIGA